LLRAHKKARVSGKYPEKSLHHKVLFSKKFFLKAFCIRHRQFMLGLGFRKYT
jgi:hypothetical protein